MQVPRDKEAEHIAEPAGEVLLFLETIPDWRWEAGNTDWSVTEDHSDSGHHQGGLPFLLAPRQT